MFVWREVSAGSVEGVMPEPWFSKRRDYGNRDKFRLHELTPISTRSHSLIVSSHLIRRVSTRPSVAVRPPDSATLIAKTAAGASMKSGVHNLSASATSSSSSSSPLGEDKLSIEMLGAGQEVGRSCCVLTFKGAYGSVRVCRGARELAWERDCACE